MARPFFLACVEKMGTALETEVHDFIQDFLRASAKTDHLAQRKVRDMFQVEVAGFSEFIAVNGKIYRYGFVSRDTSRTCAMVRAMFDNDLERFNEVMGWRLSSWDDLTAPKLRLHVRNNHQAVRALNDMLPAPMVSINDATRGWLKSVYENIERLNAQCNTGFNHWEDVVLTPAISDACQRETGRDIEEVRDILAQATTMAMTTTDDWIHDLFHQLHQAPPRTNLPHGHVEILFATLASFEPACIETFYVMLMLFLASSTQTELTVPSYTGEDAATERANFLVEYFDTTTRSAQQEWRRVTGQSRHEPLRVLVKDISSSLKNFDHFVSLVNEIVSSFRFPEVHDDPS